MIAFSSSTALCHLWDKTVYGTNNRHDLCRYSPCSVCLPLRCTVPAYSSRPSGDGMIKRGCETWVIPLRVATNIVIIERSLASLRHVFGPFYS